MIMINYISSTRYCSLYGSMLISTNLKIQYRTFFKDFDTNNTLIFVLSHSFLCDLKYFVQNPKSLAKCKKSSKICKIFSMLPQFRQNIIQTFINKCLHICFILLQNWCRCLNLGTFRHKLHNRCLNLGREYFCVPFRLFP